MVRAVSALIFVLLVGLAACGEDRSETPVVIDAAVLAQPHSPGDVIALGNGVTLKVLSADVSERLSTAGSGDPLAILMLVNLRFENKADALIHGPTFRTTCGEDSGKPRPISPREYDARKPIPNGTTDSYVVLYYPKWCVVEGKLIAKFADGGELTWAIPAQ